MSYMLSFIVVFVVFGVMVLGLTYSPYHGVVSIMGVSFFCCVFMLVMGRTFMALLMYIVYLGGLVVVFGYCVSVEKGEVDIFKVVGSKYFMLFALSAVVVLWWVWASGVGGLLVYTGWEDLVCLEVNGGGVLYFSGGVSLIVCSWGLLVVLFSILVILSWSRLGGFRSF